MKKALLNLSNHALTGKQLAELVRLYSFYDVYNLEGEDKATWAQLTPQNYRSVCEKQLAFMLENNVGFAHVAGFPPAVCYMVELCKANGIKAFYAYSKRVSSETLNEDGSVTKINNFEHIGFFEY